MTPLQVENFLKRLQVAPGMRLPSREFYSIGRNMGLKQREVDDIISAVGIRTEHCDGVNGEGCFVVYPPTFFINDRVRVRQYLSNGRTPHPHRGKTGVIKHLHTYIVAGFPTAHVLIDAGQDEAGNYAVVSLASLEKYSEENIPDVSHLRRE